MTNALYIQARKEMRALLPWWLCVMLATIAMAYVAVQSSGLPFFRYDQQMWLVMVYAAGVLVLAALSVGQELAHGTLAALLVQPVDRGRVLWTKIGETQDAFSKVQLGGFNAIFVFPTYFSVYRLSIYIYR